MLSFLNISMDKFTVQFDQRDADPLEEDNTPGKPGGPPGGGVAQHTILIVDDDVALGKFLSRELKLKSFAVQVLNDGEEACCELVRGNYDLVILDLNLPKMDGVAVLKQMRHSHPRTPILVLTARNRTEDLVLVLEQGADDCLIKPFSFLELSARMNRLLRRHSSAAPDATHVADLTLNRDERRVSRGGRRIDLTPREFAILECLMANIGKPVSRMTLMREVWNIPFDPSTNIVDVYMKYLRDKINDAGEAKLIRTVRGVGYVLSLD
jgi:DNA-binding response OmpR family regulator